MPAFIPSTRRYCPRAAVPALLVLAAAACGTDHHRSDALSHVQGVSASVLLADPSATPSDVPAEGLSFAPGDSSRAHVSAAAAVEAAKNSGVNVEAFTDPDERLTVCFALFTDSVSGSPSSEPVWVITGAVQVVPHLPAGHTEAPTPFDESGDWVVDAVSGHFVKGGSHGR